MACAVGVVQQPNPPISFPQRLTPSNKEGPSHFFIRVITRFPCHRARDDEAGRAVDSVTGAMTRASEGIRVKQQQAAANAAAIDSLSAQAAEILVNERSLAEAENGVQEVEDRLRAKSAEQVGAPLL